MDELKPEYIIVIGIIAPWIAQGIKLLGAKFGDQLGRKYITAGLFVMSMVLVYFWMKPALPPLPPVADDPVVFAAAILTFVAGIITATASVTGLATTIYNLLYQRVFEKLDIGKERVVRMVENYHLDNSNLPF
jgi:hypothetical protein